MRRIVASFFAVSLLLPAWAGAQGGAKLEDVERGVWAAAHAGAVVYLDLPGESSGTAVGSLIGVEVGVDVLRQLQFGVLAWGQSVDAPADYQGITDDALDPKGARGDFQLMMLGAGLRWSFLQLADDNGVDRTYFFARAGAGTTFSRPVGILDDQGIFGLGGLGVEYFTRLRHFSVGLELNWMGLFGDVGEAHAIAILPHLKYTF